MSAVSTKIELSKKGQTMKTIKAMNNDIQFVKVMSVYGYVIFSSIAMLVGLVIGLRN